MKTKNIVPPKVDFYESMAHSYNYNEEYCKTEKYWVKAKEDYENFFINGELSDEYRIPKKIHQIWLGSEFPRKYKRWAESWKKYHPDWEYYLWTDEEVAKLKFEKPEVFYETTNFGPKSDILRYEVLNRFGGLYVDTDFECFKPFDYLHMNVDFYAGIIFGDELETTTSIIASAPGHPIIRKLLKSIDKPVKTDDHHEIHKITGPWAFSDAYREMMFDDNYRHVLMPVTYFFPFPNNKLHIQSEKKILEFCKKETMGLHYWEVSWLNQRSLPRKLVSKLLRYIPAGAKHRVKKLSGKKIKTREDD